MLIKIIALNSRYTHSCLSLFYIRNQVRKLLKNARISIEQYTVNDPYFATLTRITEGNPDLVFFSVYIWNSHFIFRLTEDINRVMPSIKIILGGPQVSFLADSDIPAGCTIVRGEIEGLDADFFQDAKNGNLVPVYNAVSSQSFSFPYQEEDFEKHLQNRHIYYESSRGCPYSCTYCLSSAEKGVRLKDIETVKQELAIILAHNPQTLRFVDRTFNIDEKRALKIWHFLAVQAKETCCHFEIGPDRFSDEMFIFLKTIEPGRFQFEIGIQSTNPATLAAVNRKTDMNLAIKNITRLIELDNIHLHVDLILGLPHETADSFQKSFNDTFFLFPHYIQMGLLKILPGTPISHQVDEFSIKSCVEPPYEVMATQWIDHDTLKRLYWFSECVEAFYNTRFFKSFFALIRESEDDYFLFFDQLLTRCFDADFFRQAKTQKRMNSLLLELTRNHPEEKTLKELLIFDWLHSGHRFLPDNLNPENLNREKEHFWKNMPQNKEPLYTYKTRNHFFKQSLFMRFSDKTLKAAGFGGQGNGVVCFLAVKEKGVMGYCKTVFFADE